MSTSLVPVWYNDKTMESKIEDQNAIIYTKPNEIENWRSDLVLHVRTELVKLMLVTDFADRNLFKGLLMVILKILSAQLFVTNIRVF